MPQLKTCLEIGTKTKYTLYSPSNRGRIDIKSAKHYADAIIVQLVFPLIVIICHAFLHWDIHIRITQKQLSNKTAENYQLTVCRQKLGSYDK